ncbi:MAG: aminotransferase class IV [Bacteroidales bacterium]|nr:aminotransferase class IV [Bacteroidales bacterium]
MENCLLNYFIVNNELRSTCDFDPAVLKQGKSIYELLRVINGKPLFLEDHIQRFFRSLQLAGLQSGMSEQQLANNLNSLIESNKLKNGNIRFQFGVSAQGRPFFLARVVPAFYPGSRNYMQGVKLIGIKAERENPNAKQDKLPVRKKADEIIQRTGVFEVLLINNNGFVTEGSRSNVFFVEGEKIVTPPLPVVLPGVTRSKIISLANSYGIGVAERPLMFEEINSFDAVFLTGTSINILPVKQIDNLRFTSTNKVMQKLQQLYDELIVEYIGRPGR